MFPPASRYFGIETAKLIDATGREIIYLRRRLLPDSGTMAVAVEHTVVERDRLDNITARYLDDPEQFWRVADANDAMQPEDLTVAVGRRLRIPQPQ